MAAISLEIWLNNLCHPEYARKQTHGLPELKSQRARIAGLHLIAKSF